VVSNLRAPIRSLNGFAVALLLAYFGAIAAAGPSLSQAPTPRPSITTGAEVLAASGYAALAGKRIGLITNHTGRVGGEHLADLLSKAPNVKLAAIFAPEHGFRGSVEAGEQVGQEWDAQTGVPVFSLYGASRRPTSRMLRDVDVLVFDIQDIGVRFYTYISTMGLAMQAAAAARVPFVVLDRPNPLGGEYVSGFVLEPALRSFVGQYPIPIVHGLTIGELAGMIKGERWLDGLDSLNLSVIEMQGWKRTMRWPQTLREWIKTSPNIPTFEAALVYPGMGIVGEANVSEGRGTPTPFSVFGAPWLDAERMVTQLNALNLPGARFETTTFTPRSIAGVAARPRFQGQRINGTRLVVTDVARIEPLEVGIHVLAAVVAEARAKGVAPLFTNVPMLDRIAGTRRLNRMLANGSSAAAIIAAWEREVIQFKAQRARYLRY
jgi:uncharacterized protein YbbC (DUF1343 family)